MMAVWQGQRNSPPQRARHWSRPSARAGEGRTPRPGALAALLRSELAPAYLVALGEVWEAAVAALSARPGRLTRPAATRLLGSWLRLVATAPTSGTGPATNVRTREGSRAPGG